jgi:hypothetical protein
MKKQFNHKSLGGFDVMSTTYERVGFLPNGTPERKRVIKRHRILVTVDAQALASLLGPKAISNKSKQTKLVGGAIQLLDLGGVVQP